MEGLSGWQNLAVIVVGFVAFMIAIEIIESKVHKHFNREDK